MSTLNHHDDPAMSSPLPLVSCLCPTYRRPARLVANAIACFEHQDYPATRRRLFVLDDAGELAPAKGSGWEIFLAASRYPTLPAKYNALAGLAQNYFDAEILVVWEDDDIYLPWHLSAIVGALYTPVEPRFKHGRAWSHPSRVWTLYGGRLRQEGARGRFHAALAMRREALEHIGGWPDTPRGDFDQQLLARLRREHGPPADPCEHQEPSYVFRWASTGSYHGEAWMRSAGDVHWYEDGPAKTTPQGRRIVIEPALDEETRQVREEVANRP